MPLADLNKLPETAYSVHLETGDTVILKRGETGFYDTGYGPQGQEIVDSLNARMGVDKAQAAAMQFGSMFGFDVPGANPDLYDPNTGRRA